MSNNEIAIAENLSANQIMQSTAVLDQVDRLATIMASGRSTLPDHIKGSKGDCAAIIMQSMQWGMNPYAVAQKTHLIKGVLGYEGQLVNAVVTQNAPIEGRIKFEPFGEWDKVVGKFKYKTGSNGEYKIPDWKLEEEEGLGVLVSAKFIGEDEYTSLRVLLSQAQTRNSTLWATDPEQQLCYFAIKKFARRFCPDVLMGVYSSDELQDENIQEAEYKDVPSTNALDNAMNKDADTKDAEIEPEIDLDALLDAYQLKADGCKTESCLDDLKENGLAIGKDNPSIHNDAVAIFQDAKKRILTPAEDPKHKYPEIMSGIHNATTQEEVNKWVKSCQHLPEDQQGELTSEGMKKIETLEKSR